jgi:hypothetical protein
MVMINVGLFGYIAYDHFDKPYCPTEDSCALDFKDGNWTITEVVP